MHILTTSSYSFLLMTEFKPFGKITRGNVKLLADIFIKSIFFMTNDKNKTLMNSHMLIFES